MDQSPASHNWTIPAILSLSILISITYIVSNFSVIHSPLMVCRNLCLRLYASTQAHSHYIAGGKYCTKCECHLITQEMFCKCCGMQLRASPKRRISREKFRAKKELIAVV